MAEITTQPPMGVTKVSQEATKEELKKLSAFYENIPLLTNELKRLRQMGRQKGGKKDITSINIIEDLIKSQISEKEDIEKDILKRNIEKTLSLKNPTETDVAKVGGIGFLYMTKKLLKEGFEEQKDRDKDGGIFEKLLTGLGLKALGGIGGTISSLMPTVLKALPIVSLIVGVAWALIDGVMGAVKSKEWGVSKTSGFIGGFLGGTGSGWKNAFSNAGKWAMIGAGAGFLVGGVVGAIAGGLIGASVGAILGYIGGEKIAKFMESSGITEFFLRVWNGIKEAILKPFLNLVDGLKSIWGDKDKSIGEKIGESVGRVLTFIWDFINPLNWIHIITNFITGFNKDVDVNTDPSKAKSMAKGFVGFIFDMIINIGKGTIKFIIDFVGGLFKGLVEGFLKSETYTKIYKPMMDGILNFLKGLWSGILRGVSFIVKIKDKIVKSLTDFVGKLWDKVLNTVTDVKDFALKIFDTVATFVGKMFDKIFGEGSFKKVIKSFTDGATKLFDIILGGFQALTDLFSFLTTDIKNIWGLITGDEGTKENLKLWKEKRQVMRDLESQADTDEKKKLLKELRSKSKQKLDEDFFYLNSKLIADTLKTGKINPNVKVQDAIITKTGKIVQTAPTDNIIATKGDPFGLINNISGKEQIKLLAEAVVLLREISKKEIKLNNITNNNLSGSSKYQAIPVM